MPDTPKRLEDRVAFVTGAASGIGEATARRLADEGAVVVGIDVVDPGSTVAGELLTVDVTEGDAVATAIGDTVARHGRLDIVVNAAGVAGGGPMHLIDEAEWHRVIAVNLTGTALVCKHAVAAMLEGDGGSIINIASVEGLEGTEAGSAYNASKGGVVLLTKNLAIDYGRSGIRSNCICPGLIDTPMARSLYDDPNLAPFLEIWERDTHLGRIGEPHEIAAAAAFLASDDASFVNGHSLVVDGGYTAGHRFGYGELLGFSDS